MSKATTLLLLAILAVPGTGAEDPAMLIESAAAAGDVAAAQPLLVAAQTALERGGPEELKARARLWHRLATERLRWRAAGCADLDALFACCRQACAAAEEAEDWPLARTVASMVRERLDPALPFVEGTRLAALRLEREACQRLGDRAGEAAAVRALLDADGEMPGLGEPYAVQQERTRRRLELCRAWRDLFRRSLQVGSEPSTPKPEPPAPVGRVPRISRLMALAIRCEQILRSGAVPDASALAHLAHVSQPRMTQILNLTLLVPDIQERLLFLDPVEEGKPEVSEKGLRKLGGDGVGTTAGWAG